MSRSIGIICYPTQGGSGIVATELGLELAARDHQVHFISYRKPFRLDRLYPNTHFHQVEISEYPLFEYPPYSLALTSKIVDVATRFGLDLVHAHYAIPHAASAWMASLMLPGGLPVVSTLHGTDITLVGQDPGYLPVTRFTLGNCQALTAVSDFLVEETRRVFGRELAVRRIHNFVDTAEFRPKRNEELRACYATPGERILLHVSNFRPVKRVPDVVSIFARLAAHHPLRLVLAGLGPERNAAKEQVAALGLAERVHFIGNQESMVDLMSMADLYLLPSQTESFGLSALEAMSCGVPVLASRVGGLPELVEDGVNSVLCPLGDVDAFVERGLELLEDPACYQRMAAAARATAEERFTIARILPQYLAVYDEVLANRTPRRETWGAAKTDGSAA
ncbi:MAG: N-acetyl-alpha-D-glucosaminyl L-malate synthase BshA [bacterium]|jgi:N-acetyl-alpha-D-glucosaminyl L-malate synthase BshA|nr:N-acetyl-alpha-D-glucosaminyl L-malate synthase BshA [bacterium]